MVVFEKFLKTKSDRNINQNAPFNKKNSRGGMPSNPPSKGRRFAPRHTSRKRDVYFTQYYLPHV